MNKEFELRLTKIRGNMSVNGIDACLISTSVNMLYASGRIFNGFYYIPLEGEPVMFVKRPNNIANAVAIRKPELIPGLLKDMGYALPGTMYVEGDEIGYNSWVRFQHCFPDCKFVNSTAALRVVRSIKTDLEVSLIKESARRHEEVYARIPEIFRPGMTDTDLAVELEYLIRKNGGLGIFRTFGDLECTQGTLLTGDNASAPSPYDFSLGGAGHYSIPVGANGTVIEKGNSIMVDMAGNFTGYLDDCSRAFSYGKLSEKAYRAHNVAIEIQHNFENAKEGDICEDFYLNTLALVERNGLSDCFMGTVQQAKFIGHGVGIVINELPVLCKRDRTVLKQNMVLALEPKFIIEGSGAVGVEDTYVIGKDKNERITKSDMGIVDLAKD